MPESNNNVNVAARQISSKTTSLTSKNKFLAFTVFVIEKQKRIQSAVKYLR